MLQHRRNLVTRVLSALLQVPAGRSRRRTAESWLERFGAVAEVSSIELRVALDFERVQVAIHAAAESIVPTLLEFLAEEEKPEALARFGGAGAYIDPKVVCAWLDLSRAGVRFGWGFPRPLTIPLVRAWAPPGGSNNALGRWAEGEGLSECSDVLWSAEREESVEMRIPIAGRTFEVQLASLQRLLDQMTSTTFPTSLMRDLDAVRPNEIFLTLGVSERGTLTRRALFTEVPSQLVDATMAAVGLDSHRALTLFQGTLGIEPHALEVSVTEPSPPNLLFTLNC